MKWSKPGQIRTIIRSDSMKNLHLLPDDLREIIMNAAWKCGCGQSGLRLSVTRRGSIQAHCFACGNTYFFNDPQLFRCDDPWAIFQKEKPLGKKMKKGGWTYWYPKSRVRKFVPGS
jgi:hypothetical protein